jgi:hypothetical protein
MRSAGRKAARLGDGPNWLSREQRWYERQRERLVREYDGEYGDIGQSVIDHDADFEALAEQVFAAQGVRNIFMPLVGVGGALRGCARACSR